MGLEATGAPFEPDEEHRRAGGHFRRSLPEDIYSAVILQWMQTEGVTTGMCSLIFGGAVPALLISFAMQVYFGMCFVRITLANGLDGGEFNADCSGGDPILKFLSTVPIILIVLHDLLTTYDMHLWLCMFPHAATKRELYLQRFVDCEAHLSSTTLLQPAPGRAGLTSAERVLIYSVIIFGKCAIALLLLVGTVGFLLRTPNDFELILNAVASAFVIEIDELLYTTLVPNAMRAGSSGFPPLSRATLEINQSCWMRARFTYLTFFSVWFKLAAVVCSYYFGRVLWCSGAI